MKYLVIGAGGTGGCIGAYMKEAGKDVTLIARGAHLNAIKEHGLRMETTAKGNYVVENIPAYDMENYNENPDVIFVCVKGYSLEDTVPFIKRVAKEDTVVIPILNIYGTGAKLQEKLPELLVTDGCIYVASQIKEPGCIQMNGDIFRVVFGVRKPEEYRNVLAEVKKDLDESGIKGELTDNIRRDALLKFSYVSPAAACGQYYDVTSGAIQQEGEIRETMKSLMREINSLALAMGITFEEDIVERNLKILSTLTPESSTSMQRDVKKGGASEIDGLILEVVRLGEKYGVDVPTYKMIADAVTERGLVK